MRFMCLNSSTKIVIFCSRNMTRNYFASNFSQTSPFREKNLSIIHHHAANISNRIMTLFTRNCDIFSGTVKFYSSESRAGKKGPSLHSMNHDDVSREKRANGANF